MLYLFFGKKSEPPVSSSLFNHSSSLITRDSLSIFFFGGGKLSVLRGDLADYVPYGKEVELAVPEK